MKPRTSRILFSLILASQLAGQAATVTVCDEPSLRAALTQGDEVVIMACDGNITLNSTILVTNRLRVDATGRLVTLNGNDTNRIFELRPGASLALQNLTLTKGRAQGATAYPGETARGGAILAIGADLHATDCRFENNIAEGGKGGDGNNQTQGSTGGGALGGGIFIAHGILRLTNCTFNGNRSQGGRGGRYGGDMITGGRGGFGAGAAVDTFASDALVTHCRFETNTCRSGLAGINGGVSPRLDPLPVDSLGAAWTQDGGTVDIQHSQFVGNSGGMKGGAVYIASGVFHISESRFDRNVAAAGGALFNLSSGKITSSELTANSSEQGGAIYNAGKLTLVRCNLGTNRVAGHVIYGREGPESTTPCFGGAIWNQGMLNLDRSSLIRNLAEGPDSRFGPSWPSAAGDAFGGAVANAGLLQATNVVLAENSALGGDAFSGTADWGGDAFGGAICNLGGTSVLSYVTLSGNQAVGGWSVTRSQGLGSNIASTNGIVVIHGTILAGGSGSINAFGTITDGGYNLCSDNSAHLTSPTSRESINPLLGPLTNNGEVTPGLKPLQGSPAIDGGDSSNFPPTDQLSNLRPRGSGVDIGAIETEFSTITDLSDNVIRNAVAAGGIIQFSASGIIPLNNPLVITGDTKIIATGQPVALSGSQSNRVFEVLPGASLTLVDLTIKDGRSTHGGGILNQGNLTLIRCSVANNTAEGQTGTNGTAGANGKIASTADPTMGPGGNGTAGEPGHAARGGGILNFGTLVVTNSTFVGNEVTGGRGGNAGFGGRAGYAVDGFGRVGACDTPGLAGQAGAGGNAFGAALYNEGSATIIGTTFVANSARGGIGGSGGVGGAVPCAPIERTSTPAGDGGSASGGAWFNAGTLRIKNSLATENLASGGAGGDAPEVVGNMGAGKGGNGGDGLGGAGADIATNSVVNSTFEGNQAKGGASGFSAHFSTIGCPFPGGNGGDGLGGALFASAPVQLRNVTIWNNEAEAGLAMATFPAGCPVGQFPGNETQFLGTNGHAWGHSVVTSNALALVNSILGGTVTSNQCVGPINDLGNNINSDSSAAFTTATSHNNTQPLLHDLANNGGPTLTMSPRSDSPAIDSGNDSATPGTDQRGVPRPQVARSDIGAVEATFLTIQRLPYSEVRIRYAGIPGNDYALEESLAFGQAWIPLETKSAGTNGLIEYSNRPTWQGPRLFRVKSP